MTGVQTCALPIFIFNLDSSNNLEFGSGQHSGGMTITTGNAAMTFTTNSSERMRIDSSGNVGIGVTPSTWTSVAGKSLQINNPGNSVWANGSGGLTMSVNAYYNSGWFYQNTGLAARYDCGNGNGTHTWSLAGSGSANAALTWSTQMTLDASGNLLVGTTNSSIGQSGLIFEPSWSATNASGFGVAHANGTASGANYAYFAYNGSGIGSITQNGTTAVAYNTSSDYRLKDNQAALTGSGSFIDALKPKTWTWKSDGTKGIGFIAHEVQEVSPTTVVGEKDAVDAEGKPVYQAMEYGSAEFIANIIAELQSLRARVAALESKGA